MDLKNLLTNIPSARERDYFVSVFSHSTIPFNDLLDSMFREKDPLKWRAAWIIDGCDEKDPALAEPHISRIVGELENLDSQGTLRSLLRLLSRHDIPEKDQGHLVDLCFKYISSGFHSAAVKVYAMEILYNQSRIYPEIGNELEVMIMDLSEYNSAGFKARGDIIIKKLKKNRS